MKKTLLTFLLSICLTIVGFSQTTWETIQNIDPSAGDAAYVIASGDLDGDTHIDIVVGTYNFSADVVKWYKNDGNGNFTLQPTISDVGTLSGIGGITVADLDGINGNDVVVGSYSNDTVMFYANDGAGGFATGVAISTIADGAGQVNAVDINNDSFLDISVAAFDGNEAIWLPGNGDGTFGAKQTIASVDQPGNVSFADFDGDGDLDALIGYVDATTSGTIEIYYNQYVESGTMTVSWIKDTTTVDSGNPFLFVAAFADVDDDGTLEIIKSDNTSGNVAYYDKVINGASTETIISDETIIDRPAVVAVADFDNDSFNDVLLTDGGSADDALIWFESTDAGGFNTEALIADHNYQVFGVTIADFDNDGDLDVASVGFFNGSVDWYENQRFTKTNALVLTGVFDGSLAGGTPKGVEIFVLQDIADLSAFGLGSANNGGGSDGEEFTFPAVAATTGQFIYVSSEAPQFDTFFGQATDYTTGAMAINGDDAVELFENGVVIDTYGDINTNGDGEVWDYTDGWAYRVVATGPDGATFVPGNWIYSGIDELEGGTNNATASTPFPIGTYSPTLSIINVDSNTAFSMYPNPNNSGLININSSYTGAIDVTIFDAIGKTILKETLTNNSVNISALSPGLYHVSLTQNNEITTKKLIVY